MNFFQILNAILYDTKTSSVDNDLLTSGEFSPFMINRWISFYDRDRSIFVNEIFNKLTGIFDDRSDILKLYVNLTPKCRFKKINYIKKINDQPDTQAKNQDEFIEVVARNQMISRRELRSYIDLQNIDSK